MIHLKRIAVGFFSVSFVLAISGILYAIAMFIYTHFSAFLPYAVYGIMIISILYVIGYAFIPPDPLFKVDKTPPPPPERD